MNQFKSEIMDTTLYSENLEHKIKKANEYAGKLDDEFSHKYKTDLSVFAVREMDYPKGALGGVPHYAPVE